MLDVESSLRATRCKQIVESLPEHNFIVAKYLLCFLHMVRNVQMLLLTKTEFEAAAVLIKDV